MGILSAITGAIASKKARKAQDKAASSSIAIQREALDLLKPSIETGDRARELLADATGVNGRNRLRQFFDEFETDPGFEAENLRGRQEVLQAQAATGTLASGRTFSALRDRGALFLRSAFNDRLNRLGGLAGGGQQAAGAAQGPLSNISNTLLRRGDTRASGFINTANAITGGVQNTLDLAAFAGGRFA